jgi:protocatechuate 3,4-dioxygenase beta subunit
MKRFKYFALAALVAVAACDEGEDPIIVPTPVTGTISGTVSIESAGISGVNVTLSGGMTASTDGSGAFTFTGVAAGSYTVTISGFASDATFTATVQSATISSQGQVATTNFDGAYVRTSAILGSVAAGGAGLSGVSVAISGMSSAGTTTDGNGQYSFSGLRAGSYTVEMMNPSASTYAFASTSASVTIGTGASEIVSFAGTLVETASIEGWLFIDEFSKDNARQADLEDNLTVAGVSVALEGILVDDNMTTVTDANGKYSFSDLAAGTYRITLDATMTGIPGMVTFGGTNPQLVTVTTGATGTVNFPFDITTQTIWVSGFLGIDGTTPGITAISGWTINLYDTQANAAAGGATGRLGAVATGTDGNSAFRFLRSADKSPNAATPDQIVFGQVAAPSGTHTLNGETIIEIQYASTDSSSMALDTFDALYNALVLKTSVAESDGDVAAGWETQSDVAEDADLAVRSWTRATDAAGGQVWDFTTADMAALGGDGALPDTIYFSLAGTQASAGGHGFAGTPTAVGGAVEADAGGNKFLRYIWDGTTSPGDTVDVGSWSVAYTDADVTVRVHHELDDSSSSPTWNTADGFGNIVFAAVELYEVTSAGNVSSQGPTAATVSTGLVTFSNVDTSKDWIVRSRTTNAKVFVLNDTTISIPLDGTDQTYTDKTLAGGAGSSTFAIKTNNNSVSGVVLADDGTGAGSIIVTLTPDSNIQGTASYKDTTSAAGAYAFTPVIEGPYTVSVENIAGTWEFNDVLTTATAASSGSANNAGAMTGDRDIAGDAVASVANFQPDRMDTSISGVVVNDRDSDFNTIDPDEALSGVTVNLIDDADGDGAIDSGEAVLATTTTDENGAYAFTALAEDDYIVQPVSPTNSTVLRALSATGAVTSHIGITTEAALGAGATLNQVSTRNVGTTSPPGINDEFPRWNYLAGTAFADGGNLGAGAGPNATNGALTTAPTHFVHLFATGTVTGQITAAGVGVAGVRVTITRCQTAATTPSPPVGGACTAKHGVPSPHIANFDTDSSGNYTFGTLLEGVYQIDVAPATAGYTTNEGLDGIPTNGDEIVLASIAGNNDVETVAAYEIS